MKASIVANARRTVFAEKPSNKLADKYGVFSWRYFDREGNSVDGGVNHDKIIEMLNPDYGDELLKEKGGRPYDYRSTICYRYPWVPFQLTLNDDENSDAKDEEKKSKYEIIDTDRGTLLASGDVGDDNKI